MQSPVRFILGIASSHGGRRLMQNRGMTRGNSNSLYFVILVIIESRKNISRKVPKKRNAKRRRRLGGDKLLYYAGLHAKIYYFSKMPRRSKKRFCMFKSSFREAPSKKIDCTCGQCPVQGRGGGTHAANILQTIYSSWRRP